MNILILIKIQVYTTQELNVDSEPDENDNKELTIDEVKELAIAAGITIGRKGIKTLKKELHLYYCCGYSKPRKNGKRGPGGVRERPKVEGQPHRQLEEGHHLR